MNMYNVALYFTKLEIQLLIHLKIYRCETIWICSISKWMVQVFFYWKMNSYRKCCGKIITYQYFVLFFITVIPLFIIIIWPAIFKRRLHSSFSLNVSTSVCSHISVHIYDTCTLKMQVLSCNANVRNACSVSACYEKDKLFCFQLKEELLFFTLFPWNKKQTQLFLTGIHFTNYTYFGTTDNGRNFRTCEISSPQSNINVTPLKWRMKHGLLGFPDRQDCK